MKKIILVGAVLSLLTGCGGDDNSRTPEGIITKSVKALYKHDINTFLETLTGPALQKLSTPDQQQALLNSLGNVKKVKFGETKVISVSGDLNSQLTASETPVMRDNQILYVVSTACWRQETHSSHWVCRHDSTPINPGHGGWGGGGITPGHSEPHPGGGGHSGGGGITPGHSEPHPGGGGGDRPPRFPGEVTEMDDCYQSYDTNVSVSCYVSDLR